MSERDSESPDELIGRIIKSAGRGPSASPEARARVYASVHAAWRRSLPAARPHPQPPAPQSRRRPLAWIAAAAAVGAVALLVNLDRAMEPAAFVPVARVARIEGPVQWLRAGGERRLLTAGTTIAIGAGDTLTTSTGGKAALELETGATLRINEQSDVEFPSRALVDLHSGTLYLDTGRRAGTGAAPGELEIRTPAGSVHHLGTQYEVHFADAAVRVRVREGAVVFRDAARELVTESGEEVLIPDEGAPVRASIDASDPAWDWAEELAVVPGGDRTLSELMGWLGRETGRDVRFADGAAEREAEALTVHGVEGLTPTELLDVVRDTTSFRYDERDGELYVSSDD